MKIAVISDTHSHTATAKKALRLIAPHKVELILHCGDIDDAETVALFPGNTHFVYGNCDMDQAGIKAAIDDIGATLHEPFGNLELAGTTIAFLHGDDTRLLFDLEHANAFDFLFHGHTHLAKEHRTGRTRVINPGALFRARPRSFVIVDLPSGHVESVTVES
jgi:putative phosphoesterase